MSKKTSPKSHSSGANAKRARLSRARYDISRRNENLLSLFRQLTHHPDLRAFHDSRILRQREATYGVGSPFLGFLKLANQADIVHRKVCQSRKERRRVLFALGKTGGNHKAPRYTELSKVRC